MSEPREEISALIQADIDGLISAQEQAQLRQCLENGGDARALYEDYQRLNTALDSLESLDPPADLMPQVMAATRPRGKKTDNSEAAPRWAAWLGIPVVRYGFAFLIGVIFSGSVLQWSLDNATSSNEISILAGTMVPRNQQQFQPLRFIDLEQLDLKGTVDLSQSGQLLNLSFALDGDRPAELAISYDSKSYSFGGFLLETGDSPLLEVEGGHISLTVHDNQKFSVRLVKVTEQNSAIELRLDRGDATEYRMKIHPHGLESDY